MTTEQLDFHGNPKGAFGRSLDKWREPVARASDPETSHLAAEDAKRNAHTLRARCLAALKVHPDGLTDFQLADLVGAQQTSAGKRRGELVAAGLVEKTDEKRPAPSGSLALVWRYKRR